MSLPSPAPRAEQLHLLIWESDVVRAGDGSVTLRAKKPLSRMSVKRAAALLGCSGWTVQKIFRAGLIHGYKPGAVKQRVDGRGSNAALVLDAGSVLAYKERQDALARLEQGE